VADQLDAQLPECAHFELKTTPPVRIIDPSADATVASLGLAPRGIVNLRWRGDGRDGQVAIRSDILRRTLELD
jgi:hypothetical protein